MVKKDTEIIVIKELLKHKYPKSLVNIDKKDVHYRTFLRVVHNLETLNMLELTKKGVGGSRVVSLEIQKIKRVGLKKLLKRKDKK